LPQIIKEYCTGKKISIILRTETYDNSLQYFLMLFEEAKKDFPNLTAEDVKAALYAPPIHESQRGIEFTISLDDKIPEGYKEIPLLTTQK